MYKLLVTTALVAVTLTSTASANAWSGSQQLTQDLETIYQSLDGQTQFDALQGDGTGNDGQLSNFFGEVAAGVTHVTLTVDENHNITPGIHAGSTFLEITALKDDLVNRVNYDLFAEDSAKGVDAVNPAYVKAVDYTGIKDKDGGKLIIGGDPETVADPANNYAGNHENGLAGRKITGLVNTVNTVNDFLIAADTTKTQSETFVAEFGNGLTSADANVVSIFTDIADLNTAINTASTGTGPFFGDIDGATFVEGNVNSFIIPSYNGFNDIGIEENIPGGYKTISDWANGLQTVVTTGGTGTIAGTGTIVVTSDADGKVTLDGTPYTFDTATKTFLAD